jgi:hypothetical protein
VSLRKVLLLELSAEMIHVEEEELFRILSSKSGYTLAQTYITFVFSDYLQNKMSGISDTLQNENKVNQ